MVRRLRPVAFVLAVFAWGSCSSRDEPGGVADSGPDAVIDEGQNCLTGLEGAPHENCPALPPTAGSPCTPFVECEYGDESSNAIQTCTTIASCTFVKSGFSTWWVRAERVGGCASGCSRLCVTDARGVEKGVAATCPARRPRIQSPCTAAGVACTYGVSGAPSAMRMRCFGGYWLLQDEVACDAAAVGTTSINGSLLPKQGDPPPGPPLEEGRPGGAYGAMARVTSAYIAHAFLGGPRSTNAASQNLPAGSYRVNDGDGRLSTFAWFDALHLTANAALGRSRLADHAPMDEAFAFLRGGKLWDPRSPGGYFAGQSLRSPEPFAPRKYVDDQAAIALAFLDAADSIDAKALDVRHDDYVRAAREVAHYLMFSGLWDSSCGGGFRWHSETREKPTQANALVAQLFFRLAERSPTETFYRDWALSTLRWLDAPATGLFDQASGTYRWYVEPDGQGMCAVQKGKFSEDQANIIEALVHGARVIGDPSYLRRAERLAARAIAELWDEPRGGGFVFNTVNQGCRLSPYSSSRATRALVSLYEASGDRQWLDVARRNVDAINHALRDPKTGAYYRLGCADGTNVESDFRQGVDQAAMVEVLATLERL